MVALSVVLGFGVGVALVSLLLSSEEAELVEVL